MSTTNHTRVQVRTSKDEKAFLERAAYLCGFKTLSEFIRVSAHEKARRDLKEFPNTNCEYKTPTEPLKLSAKDSLALVESILNVKEPSELLKVLFSNDNAQLWKELIAKQNSKK